MDHWLELRRMNGTSVSYELRLKSPTLGALGKMIASAYYKTEEGISYNLFLKTESSNNGGELFGTAKDAQEADTKLYDRIKVHAESLSQEKKVPLEIKVSFI